MPQTAAHESKDARRLCETCQERKARFRFLAGAEANKDHTLCFECFRSERDRRRAAMLAEVDWSRPMLASLASPHSLTAAQVTHRQRMLSHLSGTRRLALRIR